MTVDSDGYVWTCSSTGACRFDPDSETWQSASIGGYTGCMADAGDDGLLWMATGQGVQGVNRETLQVEKSCPNTNGTYGISIDFQGNVWGVNGSGAKRIDPDTCMFDTYAGLTGPYTYSDMTGFALANAGTPSG
jgi:streptogramin lyase